MRAKGDVTDRLATLKRVTIAGKESPATRAGLGLAERGLALLRGRQRFLWGEPPLDQVGMGWRTLAFILVPVSWPARCGSNDGREIATTGNRRRR